MTSLFHALSVHVEPLVTDARIIVVGNSELGLGPALLELGAHSVHVYDPVADRAFRTSAGLPRGVVHRPMEGTIDVRDEAFDVAIVPDVAALEEPDAVVRDLRRLVTDTGAVVALARAGGDGRAAFPGLATPRISYDGLYELFAEVFPSVTMHGVLPFQGVVFAELGTTDDVAVSVDSRLAEPDPPEVFVVVASRRGGLLDPYAIVQVPPAAEVGGSGDRLPVAASRHDDDATVAYAAMQLRAETLGAQLEDHREHLALAEARGVELSGMLREVLTEREAEQARLRELEAALLVAQRVIGELEARSTQAEDALAGSVDAFERQLQERAAVIQELTRELERREHLVKELVATIDEPEEPPAGVRFEAIEGGDAPDVDALRAKLDALALDAARREGELVARGWRIAELEQQLARRAVGAPERAQGTVHVDPAALADDGSRARSLESELGRAQDELDALRQALAQEHGARLAAESGEELARARAQLQEQTVLLRQLEERLRELSPGAPSSPPA